MSSIKVATRVRPFNKREIEMNSQLVIQMTNKSTRILNDRVNRSENLKTEFTFDYSYWSHDNQSANFASQEMVYNDLGAEVVDCAFEGYNACVFAYGQTGSGKTYTMMGSSEDPGLIPRICKALFEKMSVDSKKAYEVNVSYLEIYQERVVDLLTKRSANYLKVREDPGKRGVYVQDLTVIKVTNYGRIQQLIKRGNSQRKTASTKMNDVSSRSHAIFTITFIQAAGYCDEGVPIQTVSKIHLVDLAGCERLKSTEAEGERLKEGAHINKSLSTLGSIISALSKAGRHKPGHIPYRDSVLTWLLKDSLGGNSKTIMLAAISPADCNVDETISTLRYANNAKNIVNKPTVNEDPNVKLIRELREEIIKLRTVMYSEPRTDLVAQLHEKEVREKELTEEWAGKWKEAQEILREQHALGLRKAGHGVVLDSDMPHLVAIDDNLLTTGVTLYHLKEGKTTIGTGEAEVKQDIELQGAGMEPQHCTIAFENGVTTLIPQPGAQIKLNSNNLDSPARLSQGYVICLGKSHIFRFNDPAEAAELRKSEHSHNLSRSSLLSWSTPDLAISTENIDLNVEDDKCDIELERQNLEKEKEQFEKDQEAFEKQQEDYVKRIKILEEAQAKLEAEKETVQKEYAEQTRQLQEDWQNLASQQKRRESELMLKEQELISKREELESEKQLILNQINCECDKLQDIKGDSFVKFSNTCRLVTLYASEITFPSCQAQNMFQALVAKWDETPLSSQENGDLVDILNNVKGVPNIQYLIEKHRKELSELQTELNQRIQTLCERQRSVELLNVKIIDLVDQQKLLSLNDGQREQLDNLKDELSKRTEEELKDIESRKQGLTLDLKPIYSTPSPDSCNVSVEDGARTGSSDTYHTAADSCSSGSAALKMDHLMCDSGVELRPDSRHQDDSDMSNCEDKVMSDSQSTSSVENHCPSTKKTKRKVQERNSRGLVRYIEGQKQFIMRRLDSKCPKAELDLLVETLQTLQRQLANVNGDGESGSMLSPALQHPLQDSPSPLRPLSTGSTLTLYSSASQVQNRRMLPYHRSMPSIYVVPEADRDSIVCITSYCLRGTGTRTHYEYEIRISTVDDMWSILRRYSRFRDLHIAMKARYKDKVSSIPFPSKTLFSNTETVAQSRKRQLETYLIRLIETCKSHPACPLSCAEPVTKAALICFSSFFRKGVFESGKYGTS